MIRHEYRVGRDGYVPSGRTLPDPFVGRRPRPEDRLALADLMMDAYSGTVDYDGEPYEQAVEEVDGYLSGEALLPQSRLALGGEVIHGAVLASLIADGAFIGYVMTRAGDKHKGIAAALLDASVAAIWAAGHTEIRAWITQGNLPSERLFTHAGFEIVGTIGVGD